MLEPEIAFMLYGPTSDVGCNFLLSHVSSIHEQLAGKSNFLLYIKYIKFGAVVRQLQIGRPGL